MMKINLHCFALSMGASLLCALPAVAAPTKAKAAPAKAAPNNAASAKYGARASVSMEAGTRKDAKTSTDTLLDGKADSRLVMIGAPYTVAIELPFPINVDKLALRQSAFTKEAAPQNVEVSFDGGAPVPMTLELKRPSRKDQAWQEIAVGREISRVTIKVLTQYPGTVVWGGLGDVALWTNTDLAAKMRPDGYDPNAPAFVHAAAPVALEAGKVKLPPLAKPGEHPRLLFTPAELVEFRAKLPQTERGKEMLKSFDGTAQGALGAKISFPTPEETAANKDGGRHEKLSKNAGILGVAYAMTGDEKYAKAAREIIIGYAERYESYPRHSGRNKNDASKVSFQRLSEAMWLIPLVESTDYIYNSGVLSEADKKQIETGLIRPAIEEIRRATPASEVGKRTAKSADWRTATPNVATQGKYPNWINYYSTATMMAGAVLGDKDMMDLAAADLRDAIARGIGADGMWGEGAIGYQLFAMGVMSPGLEAAARNGYDIWNSSGGRFKMLFDSPLRYAYPDGSLPGINDSSRGKLGSWQTMVYDYGYLRYGDPAYAYLVNASPRQLHQSPAVYQPTRVYETLPEPPTVKMGSTLFANLGYAILRDDTKYALMDYGPHGGVHGHYDKLNLLLFAAPPEAKGDEMGGEPRFHGYDDKLHDQWTIQSVAHNTMTLDERSQFQTTGKITVYEDTPNLKIMRAEAAGAYAGVLLDRTVVTLPDAVIDVFSGAGKLDHVWDRTLRFKGELQGAATAPDNAEALGENDGYQHIRVGVQKEAAKGWNGVWKNETGLFSATVVGAPGQQVIEGVGPDKEAIAIARQKGKSADVAAIYALDSWQNPIKSSQMTGVGDAVRAVEMTQQDGTQTRVLIAHNAGAWQAAGWSSDARVLVVRQKGDALEVLIGGGTFAKNGALEARQSAAGNLLARKKGAVLETVSSWSPPMTADVATVDEN